MKELKYWAVVFLVIAAALWGFLTYSHSFKTAPPEVIVVKDPCKVCGQSLYREELDFYMTTWIGDVPILVPIYKTVLHTCKGHK